MSSFVWFFHLTPDQFWNLTLDDYSALSEFMRKRMQ